MSNSSEEEEADYGVPLDMTDLNDDDENFERNQLVGDD